ncbi:uncharacterized protein [Dasypus novemcinctus]|uniref:uncharacterized protein n=1 Tax=Dasypus novemcinctus TaxID=9361 RepID=UPI00265DAE67|nr:uncharacterized protein LOC131277650 [Dasypus novemcinctus]XP_058148696.1 uncharacterized protein LOC131277650 [Dasypus novemcinctus]XP_058148697.1 uncharacterized protein LOC131277650 [Dasypus novemcinctus]
MISIYLNFHKEHILLFFFWHVYSNFLIFFLFLPLPAPHCLLSVSIRCVFFCVCCILIRQLQEPILGPSRVGEAIILALHLSSLVRCISYCLFVASSCCVSSPCERHHSWAGCAPAWGPLLVRGGAPCPVTLLAHGSTPRGPPHHTGQEAHGCQTVDLLYGRRALSPLSLIRFLYYFCDKTSYTCCHGEEYRKSSPRPLLPSRPLLPGALAGAAAGPVTQDGALVFPGPSSLHPPPTQPPGPVPSSLPTVRAQHPDIPAPPGFPRWRKALLCAKQFQRSSLRANPQQSPQEPATSGLTFPQTPHLN